MALATNLGFPRIGVKRELKKAVEAFWSKKISEQELQATATELRARHWNTQKDAGIAHIPSNDFSFYDQVLDTIAMVGAVPARYNFAGGQVDLATYFAMARGEQSATRDVGAMEMTKWFDTNYHYLVPEFEEGQSFSYASTKAVDQYKEAKALGIDTRPVLVGPLTFLLSGKIKSGNALSLLPQLLPIYAQVLSDLKAAGADWVQIDEPYLCMDLSDDAKQAYQTAYAELNKVGINILTTTYFDALEDNLQTAATIPTQALHIDLVRAPNQLDAVIQALPEDKILSLGLVNGRNIWITDLQEAIQTGQKAIAALGSDRVWIAGSCSLLHSPVDLAEETKLDAELKSWMAFATQKLAEINTIAAALNGQDVQATITANEAAIQSRNASPRVNNQAVKDRVAAITPAMSDRASAFAQRQQAQEASLNLPAFPTTTIGSFPQTPEIRKIRASFKRGDINEAQYNSEMETAIADTVKYQEGIGIDVLVHGEFERNDMVEYFGELMDGFAFTKNGWVQSYGSRCVKPPVIFGDVSRPTPMTVNWTKYAQNLTPRLMKGMLTGPVTILQWSFVRDDQPRQTTCQQIGLAIRDEVVDLETAGIKVIQIDEPAFREGLPLRQKDWKNYLDWAVDCFRLSACGVRDETQIHTHMCYSEFNDTIQSIADMDADVISIETSRSQMELLEAFVDFQYPNEIGPGVYDIHSPRTPSTDEMVHLLQKATKNLAARQIWVNPDCGLKTRKWDEVKPALANMVEAAEAMRAKANGQQAA